MTSQTKKHLAFDIVCDRLLEVLYHNQNQEKIFNSFSTAWILIYDTFELLQENFPVATVSDDGDQGIEITWKFENSKRDLINNLRVSSGGDSPRRTRMTKMQLSCSCVSEKYTYLSCEFDGRTNVLHDVSALTLACWLQWVNLNKTLELIDDQGHLH